MRGLPNTAVHDKFSVSDPDLDGSGFFRQSIRIRIRTLKTQIRPFFFYLVCLSFFLTNEWDLNDVL